MRRLLGILLVLLTAFSMSFTGYGTETPSGTEVVIVKKKPIYMDLSIDDIKRIDYEVGSVREGKKTSLVIEVTERKFLKQFLEEVNQRAFKLPFPSPPGVRRPNYLPPPAGITSSFTRPNADRTEFYEMAEVHQTRFYGENDNLLFTWHWEYATSTGVSKLTYTIVLPTEIGEYVYRVKYNQEGGINYQPLKDACTSAYLKYYGLSKTQLDKIGREFISTDNEVQKTLAHKYTTSKKDAQRLIKDNNCMVDIFPDTELYHLSTSPWRDVDVLKVVGDGSIISCVYGNYATTGEVSVQAVVNPKTLEPIGFACDQYSSPD